MTTPANTKPADTKTPANAAKPDAGKPANAAAAKPGRKPGPAKEYDFGGLSLDLLAAPQEVTAAMASQFAPSRPRDEKQVAMDQVVNNLYQQWLKAGSPSKWAAMPKVRYHIPPAAEDGFRFLVRRAADFYGIAIKWGGQQGTKVRDANGNIVIVFSARDRRTNETADATDVDESSETTSETSETTASE